MQTSSWERVLQRTLNVNVHHTLPTQLQASLLQFLCLERGEY
jgi:hypothetical protein